MSSKASPVAQVPHPSGGRSTAVLWQVEAARKLLDKSSVGASLYHTSEPSHAFIPLVGRYRHTVMDQALSAISGLKLPEENSGKAHYPETVSCGPAALPLVDRHQRLK